jgi:hypothetical protein
MRRGGTWGQTDAGAPRVAVVSFVALVALNRRGACPPVACSTRHCVRSRATSSTKGRTVVVARVEGCGVQASAPRRRSCLMRTSLAETGTTDGRRYCAPGHSRARNSQKCPPLLEVQRLRIERVRRRCCTGLHPREPARRRRLM